MSEYILELKNLQISYGPIKAVKGIDMKVKEGNIVAILGANGAGKTSTLRTISGLVKSSGGEIIYKGENITSFEPEKITRMGISQSPEGRQIFPDLTVYENLQIGAYVLKDKAQINKNLERCYKYFPVLQQRKEQLAATLSGGEQQMLAIARALMSSPEILLLDEPSLGLAPIIVVEIMEIIKEITKEGTTVVIVEQNAAQTLKIADYGYVLELGRVSTEGEGQVLLNDTKLIESYLGGKK